MNKLLILLFGLITKNHYQAIYKAIVKLYILKIPYLYFHIRVKARIESSFAIFLHIYDYTELNCKRRFKMNSLVKRIPLFESKGSHEHFSEINVTSKYIPQK